MDELTRLNDLLTRYLDDVDEVMRTRKPADGILGMGNPPQNDPCHDRFDQQLGQLMAEFAAAPVTPETAGQLVSFLLHDEELDHGVQCARLMLLAGQRHCMPLITLMSADDARSLHDWYVRKYPRLRRFPVQGDIIKALKKRACK